MRTGSEKFVLTCLRLCTDPMNRLHSDFLHSGATPSKPSPDYSLSSRHHRTTQSLGRSPSWLLPSKHDESSSLNSSRCSPTMTYSVDQADQWAGKQYAFDPPADQTHRMFGAQRQVMAEYGDWQRLSGHRRAELSANVQERLVSASAEDSRSNGQIGLEYVSTSPTRLHLQSRPLGASPYDPVHLQQEGCRVRDPTMNGVSQMRLDGAGDSLKPLSDSPECPMTTMTGTLPYEILYPLSGSTMNLVARQSSGSSKPINSDAPHQANKSKNECELCGAKSSLLTTLFPCCHRACSFCMSSGLNQVSTSPPRDHTCAACGTHVDDIEIDKSGLHLSGWASRVTSSPPIVAEDGSPSAS